MSENSEQSRMAAPEAAAALLLRLSLGMLFFMAGLGKFLGEGGASGVSLHIIKSFKDTFLPTVAVTLYACVLPYAEVLLGLGLLIGIFTKQLLPLCGLLLLSLAFGKMVQQDHQTVGQILNYVLVTAVALWFAAKDNRYSLDSLLKRK